MKQLKDMNLVDDFLAYSLTVHKTYGEEASRYILECILQRKIRRLTVVPQKPWPGDTPEKYRVRLDVYLDEEDGEIFDIEPDNNSSSSDVNALPRQTMTSRIKKAHPFRNRPGCPGSLVPCCQTCKVSGRFCGKGGFIKPIFLS